MTVLLIIKILWVPKQLNHNDKSASKYQIRDREYKINRYPTIHHLWSLYLQFVFYNVQCRIRGSDFCVQTMWCSVRARSVHTMMVWLLCAHHVIFCSRTMMFRAHFDGLTSVCTPCDVLFAQYDVPCTLWCSVHTMMFCVCHEVLCTQR